MLKPLIFLACFFILISTRSFSQKTNDARQQPFELCGTQNSTHINRIIYDKVWNLIIESSSTGLTLLRTETIFRFDTMFVMAPKTERLGLPLPNNEPGNTEGRESQKSTMELWLDFFKEPFAEFCKILLLPLLAMIFLKKKDTNNSNNSILVALAIFFSGLILWTLAKNFHYHVDKTINATATGNPKGTVPVKDTVIVIITGNATTIARADSANRINIPANPSVNNNFFQNPYEHLTVGSIVLIILMLAALILTIFIVMSSINAQWKNMEMRRNERIEAYNEIVAAYYNMLHAQKYHYNDGFEESVKELSRIVDRRSLLFLNSKYRNLYNKLKNTVISLASMEDTSLWIPYITHLLEDLTKKIFEEK